MSSTCCACSGRNAIPEHCIIVDCPTRELSCQYTAESDSSTERQFDQYALLQNHQMWSFRQGQVAKCCPQERQRRMAHPSATPPIALLFPDYNWGSPTPARCIVLLWSPRARARTQRESLGACCRQCMEVLLRWLLVAMQSPWMQGRGRGPLATFFYMTETNMWGTRAMKTSLRSQSPSHSPRSGALFMP